MTSKYLLVYLLTCLKTFCHCFEPLSGTSAVTAAVAGISYASYNYFKCKYTECCDDNWIHFDEQKFQKSLKENLFGQHLATTVVHKTLRGFFKNKNPKKALVMSFHGLTGSGKNHISNMIVECIFKQGTDSSYVHIYSGLKDFPHKAKVSAYQDTIREDVIRYTKECGRSLFIFDEIDKMPPGTLDALKPFIDYYEFVDGVDYRKNIFIFLSNAGSSNIAGLTLQFWAEGRDREEITMKDIEPLVHKESFNINGGFQFSELLRTELIDVFVPFLPLEEKHVRQCIEAEYAKRGKIPTRDIVKQISEEMVYIPEDVNLYSKSGCKRIVQKVDMYEE